MELMRRAVDAVKDDREALERDLADALIDVEEPEDILIKAIGVLRDHPHDLSEGQRLALVLAIQLAAAPRVILLDEPTRGLDYPTKRRFAGVLRTLAARDHAVLVATHDVELAAIVAERVLVLAAGDLVADGPPEEILSGSTALAPQVSRVLGPGWLTVDQVRAALVTPVSS